MSAIGRVGSGKVERRAEPAAGAGKSGLDGPQRDVEGGGDLGLVQFGPDEQVEDVGLLGRQLGQAAGERAAQSLGVELCLGAVLGGARFGTERGDRPQFAHLHPAVAPGDVGGDAEEPGAGVVPPRIEAPALVEGDEEGLRRRFLGALVVEPPPQVAVDHLEWRSKMTPKARGSESEAAIASPSVRVGAHTPYLPDRRQTVRAVMRMRPAALRRAS